MTKYAAQIPHTVCGIPCLIGVLYFNSVSGSYSKNAASDMDYYGYAEYVWDLLDTKGRYAEWLDKKLKPIDRTRINNIIEDHMKAGKEQ